MLALKNKVLTYSKIGAADLKYAAQFCKEVRVKKGQFLSEVGRVVDKLYFMQKGCVIICVKINGEEKVIEFFTENDIFTDFYSYLRRVPAQSYMRVLENSVMIGVKKEHFEQILRRSHDLEHFGRKFLEERLLEGLIGFQNSAVLSNEERYLRLARKRPGLFQRVPQYLIASYLGLTPVGLSKIRKRLSER